MTPFSWPKHPSTDAEFDALMSAIDLVLESEGLKPFQRPLHVCRKLWDAFKWSGSVVPPRALADEPGFEGDVLMAKSYRWYDNTYGSKLNSDGAYGFAPARLGNAIWRVRAAVTYGTVQLFIDRNLSVSGNTFVTSRDRIPASMNILRAVEELPQGLADRLSEGVLKEHMDFHLLMHNALQWRAELPQSDLLHLAHADYDESTASVLAGRHVQARWAAQQAVEKTLKGLLKIAGTPYPTGGSKGHDLEHLGELLLTHHGVSVPVPLLKAASCSTKVRYLEEPSTEAQALLANHAVLGILDALRRSDKLEVILSAASKSA